MKITNLLVLMALLAMPLATGCGGDDSVGVATAEATEALTAKMPDRADLKERLGIDDDQAATLVAAMEELQEHMEARRASQETGPPEDGSHPLRDLLVVASDTLDTDQFAGFTAMLVEIREEHRAERQAANAERRQGRGQRGERPQSARGPRGDGAVLTTFLTDILDLDEAQQAKLTELHDALRARMEEIRASGERPDREEMQALRDEALAGFAATLDEDQAARFEALQGLVPGPGRHGRRARG